MSDLLVLWDVDGTLLDAGGVGNDLYEIVFSSLFGRRCDQLAPMAGRTDRAIILDTLQMAGIAEPRRLVDPFIEGLRQHSHEMLPVAQQRAHALPGAASVLAAVASARISAGAIGFAVPGTALPDGCRSPGMSPLSKAASAVPAAAASAALARAAIPAGGIIPAGSPGIPFAVIPPPVRTQPSPAPAPVPATTPAPGTAPASVPAPVPASSLRVTAGTPFPTAPASFPPMTATPGKRKPATVPVTVPAGRPRPQPGRVYQSVLTGNVRQVAEVKLTAVGLRQQLDLCIGAYGDDHEIRTELVHLARRRASGVYGAYGATGIGELTDFEGQATVIVGDTPLDIEAALAAGARAVGVATGPYSAQQLRDAGAHAVLDDLTSTPAVLSALLG